MSAGSRSAWLEVRPSNEGALALYNKELEVTSGKELPKEVSGDNALLLLDRSMIQQQLQRYEDSSRDLETAGEVIQDEAQETQSGM